MKGKKVFAFNCLCCDKTTEHGTLTSLQASEHLCPQCSQLDPKEYAIVLSVTSKGRSGKGV